MTDDATSTKQDRLNSIRYAVRSDVGRKRDENQDSFGVLEGHTLKVFLVADGMGGARGGAVASGLAIELIKTGLRGREDINTEAICNVIQSANKAIAEKGSLEPSLAGMGTTLVGLAFCQDKTFMFHVGDSRLYRLGKTGFSACTEDHTLVQELLKSGAIGPEQAKNHPVSHMLTRSLGPTNDLKVDCYEIESGPYFGERYLLCSDGLYNQISDQELAEHLKLFDLEEGLTKLIDLANERGGPDNITAMIVELGAAFPEDPNEVVVEEEVETAVEEANLPVEDIEPEPETVIEKVVENKNSKNKKIAPTSPLLFVAAILSMLAVVIFGASTFEEFSGNPQEAPVDEAVPTEVATAKPISTISNPSTAVPSATVFSAVVTPEVERPTVFPRSGSLSPVTPSVGVPTAILPMQLEQNNAAPTIEVLQTVAPQTPSASAPLGIILAPTSLPIVPKNTPIIFQPDVNTAIQSGDKALLSRQKELEESIIYVGEQLEFLISSAAQRDLRLQELNDDKAKLSAELARLVKEENDWKAKLESAAAMAKSIEGKDPIATAIELSKMFPKIAELHKAFEKATNEYLKAVSERKAYSDNQAKIINMEAKLAARTTSFNKLKVGISDIVNEDLQNAERMLTKISVEIAMTNAKLTANEQQRSNYLNIVAARNDNEIAATKSEILAEIKRLKSELDQLHSD